MKSAISGIQMLARWLGKLVLELLARLPHVATVARILLVNNSSFICWQNEPHLGNQAKQAKQAKKNIKNYYYFLIYD